MITLMSLFYFLLYCIAGGIIGAMLEAKGYLTIDGDRGYYTFTLLWLPISIITVGILTWKGLLKLTEK